MNPEMYEIKVRKPALILSSGFLMIHIAMAVMFYVFKVTPMVFVNLFSILFYIGTFFLIRHRYLRTFIVTVFLEVMIHMFLAVIFVGWNSGFQISMIGMVILGFYAEYAFRSVGRNYISGIALGMLALAFYLNAYTISYHFPAPYSLPTYMSYSLQVIWAFVVFGIDFFLLNIFVQLTLRSEQELSYLVAHDKLTGLFTRYFMNDYLERFREETHKENSWIAIADIDDFKKVNDTYGHNCGDYVLKTVSSLLRENLPDAIVCRWGGEEFLVFGKCDTHNKMKELLDKARSAIEHHPFSYEGADLSLTVTIGAAGYPSESTIEQWVDQADKKLYIGKCNGKNQVVTA